MKPYYQTDDVTLYHGDCREVLPTLDALSVQCCVTSPPYWGLRDYGEKDQLGLEETPEEYVENMVDAFREVWRVLRVDGTLWLNLGDKRNSGAPGGRDPDRWPKQSRNNHITKKVRDVNLKRKDLVGIPWRVAFALQSDGWCLRQDIIWHKPNPMPESVTDRCTTAHEYIFLLSKSAKYCYDADAIKEPSAEPWRAGIVEKCFGPSNPEGTMRNDTGREVLRTITRNKRSVWTVATKPFKGAHFATFPPDLIEPCILAGCPEGGVILDPFHGAGTTGMVAQQNGRRYVGCELNAEYIDISKPRLQQPSLF